MNYITTVTEDEFGLAWIGTPLGLARFDGSELHLYTHDDEDSTSIAGNFIDKIVSDVEHGKIWVATNNGVSYFDLATQKFKNYASIEGDPNSIPSKSPFDILKDRSGEIWLAFQEGGLRRYRPETDDFKHYDQCLDINSKFGGSVCGRGAYSIEQDLYNDSILWVGARGLNRFNKITGSYQNFTVEMQDKEAEPQSNVPMTILAHTDGKIYYGTFFYGVFVFDPKTEQITQLNPRFQEGVKPLGWGKRVQTIYPKSSDELWISTSNGVLLYDIPTNCITKTYTNTDKRSYSIDHIDKYQRIWSASKVHGFQMFNPVLQQVEKLRFVNEDSKFPSYAIKIIEDERKKRLFVAAHSSKGLYIYDQLADSWELIPIDESYISQKGGFFISDMIQLEDGTVLILEDQAIYYYQDGFTQLKKYPKIIDSPTPKFHNIIKDHKGSYWITCSSEKLLKADFNKGIFQSFKKKIDSLSQEKLVGMRLTEDTKRNIWIQETNGLLIYERSTNKIFYHPHQQKDLKKLQWLGPIEADSNGGIWIATRTKFLAYAHSDSLDKGILRYYGKKEGLRGSSVASVRVIDEQLLVFTEAGIQWFDPIEEKFTTQFDQEYGFPKPYNHPNELSSGKYVIGLPKQLAFFHPKQLRHNPELPRAYISSFEVFDKKRDISMNINAVDSIYLSFKDNYFSFGFSSIGFNLPEKITFKYILEGFDKQWQDGTKRKFKSYTNVPGGDYVFKVVALNSEGKSLGIPAEVFIHISTVWYKTIWFWSLVILSTIAVFFSLYKWRILQVRKEERLRVKYEQQLRSMEMSALRAQMNPHFIFNSLSSIEYFIISKEPEKASDYLNRFSRLIRLVLQNSKSTTVPLLDDLEALKLYIEIESMRFDDLFDYDLCVERDINLEKIKIPPLLLQPFVENAIWHGLMPKKEGRGKIDIKIRRESNTLICLIEDNGIGREAAAALKPKPQNRRKSFGLNITSDRLEGLNRLSNTKASVKVFDLKDEYNEALGTLVELVIPL
ncbi:MAG: histidine kinase [Bacteroidota bacterium]